MRTTQAVSTRKRPPRRAARRRVEPAPNSRQRPVAEVRRLYELQVDAAVQALRSGDAQPDVHDARKRLKQARALLRLLRPAIGDGAYLRENITLRDAARSLARVRDSEALTQTLDRLMRRYPRKLPPGRFEGLRKQLRRERSLIGAAARPNGEIAATMQALRAARRRAGRWRSCGEAWNLLGSGLRATYRRGRRAGRAARAAPSPERLHEWRKQAKYLWHQLQALTPTAPGPLGELADELHSLSGLLGDDHDLAVLRDKAREHADALDGDAAAVLAACIDRRRAWLEAKAFAIGRKAYRRRSRDFAAASLALVCRES